MSDINYKYLEGHLAETGKAGLSPVCLIYGEDVLCKSAFDTLLNTLLPPSERSLNYEPVDNDNVYDAIERANTFSLLYGTKVVALLDSRIFYSKQEASRFLEKARTAYDDKEMKKAAKYVTGLLGSSGLSLEDVGDEAKRRKNLKLSSDLLADAKWLDEIIRYCSDNGISVPAAKDSASDLQEAIEKGFPDGNHLIITTDLADKRRTLFKAISKAGMVVDCSVPKGNRREDKMARDLVLNERMKAILGRSGKIMDRGAYQAMCEMIGFDLRTFSNNLEKLVSYVGSRKKITAEDVASVLKRTKQEPIYELTSAISERNVEDALFFLDALLGAGFFPLQVLGAIINQIRKVLLVKGFVESREGKVWKPWLSYQQFQARVMPAVQEYDKGLLSQLETWDAMLSKADDEGDGKKKKKGRKKKSKPATDVLIAKNPRSVYPVYLMLQKSEKFTTPGLLEAMEKLSQADLRLKTTGQNPKIILEDAIFHICC
ncbi:MAG: hypothetical protein B6245_07785 [Desulfobacteraceae bacterium 4572_88]|nr:MAG: hypothetical protein B6245_07785 [Desulfobacteraceae bacterium 4572_88]